MKKLLTVILAVILVLSLVSCGAPKGIKANVYSYEEIGTVPVIGAEVYYPENAGLEPGGSLDYLMIDDKEEGYGFSVILNEDESYPAKKELDKSYYGGEGAYEEVKYAGYEGYATFNNGYYTINLLLEEEPSDKGYRFAEIEVETSFESFDEASKFVKEHKEIQQMIKSFKYLGVVEEIVEPAEEE